MTCAQEIFLEIFCYVIIDKLKMEKFTKLGLSKGLTDVLKEFHFKEPSEIQEKAIPIALAGKDIIGGSATGSGKTLAFASAMIENLKPYKKIQALILTPTRELAEQVASSIRDFGKNKNFNVLAVYGGVNIRTQIRKLASTDILVGTPGRIIDHLNRKTLSLDKVKILVLDEVDRMFDMGFRKDVEKIINECPKKRQTMMFSATISQEIDYLSQKYTKSPIEIAVKSFVDPAKLKQVYYDVPDNKKFSLLVSLLKKENADLVMVFCNTRRNVDLIAENLLRQGIHAKAIHGKIEQKKRIKVLGEFHKKGLGVLVCTDVAARGLDIKGVSHVYNYDIPPEAKDYIHRIGRTARAGKEGKAITILASRDYTKFGNIMNSDEINIGKEKLPEIEYVRIKMDSRRDDRYNRRPRERGDNGPRRGRRGDGPRGRESNRPPRRVNVVGKKPRRREEDKERRGSSRNSYSRRPNSGRPSIRRNSPRGFSRGRRQRIPMRNYQ
jgi:ATP-dependent RNA helicase DeaD